jgi:hypothetical protein
MRITEAVGFFPVYIREDNDAIIKKFEAANVMKDFEYDFKIFFKALDIITRKRS